MTSHSSSACQHGGAHQQDLPPAALEKFQSQQFHRLAAFPVNSRKMSSKLLPLLQPDDAQVSLSQQAGELGSQLVGEDGRMR